MTDKEYQAWRDGFRQRYAEEKGFVDYDAYCTGTPVVSLVDESTDEQVHSSWSEH